MKSLTLFLFVTSSIVINLALTSCHETEPAPPGKADEAKEKFKGFDEAT